MEKQKFETDKVREDYWNKCTDEQKIEILELEIKNIEDKIHYYSKSRFYTNEIKHLAFMNSLAERIKLKESQIKKLRK